MNSIFLRSAYHDTKGGWIIQRDYLALSCGTIMFFKVVLTYESVNENPICASLNESFWEVLFWTLMLYPLDSWDQRWIRNATLEIMTWNCFFANLALSTWKELLLTMAISCEMTSQLLSNKQTICHILNETYHLF